MAQQYRVKRKIASVAVVPGGFATLDLPRQYDLESLFLRINGNVVAVGAGGVLKLEAPSQIISRVEVISDGKNTLVSTPFTVACLGNVSRRGLHSGARALTPPTSGAAGTYAVEANAAIDFAMLDGIRPKDTNYRTSGLSLFQLRLTFGATSDLYSTQPATSVSFTNMLVDVYVTETVELPDATGTYSMPIALKKVSYQEIAIAATNANQELRLPAGNLIRSVAIRTEISGDPSTAVLNGAQLVAGLDVRSNDSAANMRAENNLAFGAITAGYYFIDMARNGPELAQITNCWDVTGQTEPKLVLDVNGGAGYKIQVVTTELIVAR